MMTSRLRKRHSDAVHLTTARCQQQLNYETINRITLKLQRQTIHNQEVSMYSELLYS